MSTSRRPTGASGLSGPSGADGSRGAAELPGSAAVSAPPGVPGAPGDSGAPGAPLPPESSGVDLARVALRAAKEQARARGAAVQQKRQAGRGGGLRSGARADGRDPLPLGAAINRLITERGWETPAAVGGVMGRWPQIVGEDVAKHCVPQRYDDGNDERVLTVQCDSTAWATQLRLLAPRLVARLNEDLGHGTVRMIKVLGPGGPPQRFGRLRAPGSKGPGDTYG
ncbi:DciA family protein [Streptomyces sp. NPDC056730]|uniref:DciA family protein n=1 Tax=unclassified Streptomyces TaxID=2593676 RepID=UPI003653C29A